MPRVRAPRNELEEKFLAIVKAHAAEIEEAYDKAKKLSDKYGIPFANYVPKKYREFQGRWDNEIEDDIEGVSHEWVGAIAPVDREYWDSSTAECEIGNGW